MYGKSFEITENEMKPDYILPIGKANIERQGNDVTLIGFSKMVGMCIKAADVLAQDGISCEVR